MDYSDIIKRARSNGKSFEDIATEFSAALNKMEESDKRGTETPTYESCETNLWKGIDDEHLTYENVADLYIMIAGADKDSIVSKMDSEEIAEFYKFIIELIKNIPLSYDTAKRYTSPFFKYLFSI